MARSLVLLALVGCVVTPTPPSASSTGDTGTPSATGTPTGGTCADEIAPITFLACAETTAAVPEPPFGDPLVLSGSGTVTEVGGSLGPIPGSAPIEGFEACGVEHLHQVRLVDDTGEIWTFGWDLSGSVDDPSVDAILPGSPLDFYATFLWHSYSSGGAILLSDDVGPLFVLERELYDSLLAPELTVNLFTSETCLVESDGREYYRASFAWTDGEVSLWAGQTATIPLTGRDLDIVLGEASVRTDCLDGCSEAWWAGWPEEP